MKRLSSRAEFAQFFESYDTWMFDCDGVLWHGDRLINGAIEVLSHLRRQSASKTMTILDRVKADIRKEEKNIIFVTNNATKSRRNYKNKFDKLGVQAEVDEIFGSAYASAVYISSVINMPKDKKVYVIGEAGLEEELRDEGIQYAGGTDPLDNTLEPFSLSSFELDTTIGAVLCGLDTSINYTKLSKAYQYLTRIEGCHFLATNLDSTYPAGSGVLPGAGSLSAPLRFALKRDPTSIGKPNKVMLDCIRAKHQFDPARTIMIGDRLDTDILFGKQGGVATLLVLTGVTSEGHLTNLGPDISPDFVIDSIGDLDIFSGTLS